MGSGGSSKRLKITVQSEQEQAEKARAEAEARQKQATAEAEKKKQEAERRKAEQIAEEKRRQEEEARQQREREDEKRRLDDIYNDETLREKAQSLNEKAFSVSSVKPGEYFHGVRKLTKKELDEAIDNYNAELAKGEQPTSFGYNGAGIVNEMSLYGTEAVVRYNDGREIDLAYNTSPLEKKGVVCLISNGTGTKYMYETKGNTIQGGIGLSSRVPVTKVAIPKSRKELQSWYDDYKQGLQEYADKNDDGKIYSWTEENYRKMVAGTKRDAGKYVAYTSVNENTQVYYRRK